MMRRDFNICSHRLNGTVKKKNVRRLTFSRLLICSIHFANFALNILQPSLKNRFLPETSEKT